jgi:hypothetical protein
MADSQADLIRLLEAELDFIESGGYAPKAGQPAQDKPMFLNSISCINHWLVPGHDSECHEDCILLNAVPAEHRTEGLPCHFIPLNQRGETVKSIEETGDRDRLEKEVKGWIRSTIERLKAGDNALGVPDVKY